MSCALCPQLQQLFAEAFANGEYGVGKGDWSIEVHQILYWNVNRLGVLNPRNFFLLTKTNQSKVSHISIALRTTYYKLSIDDLPGANGLYTARPV
jgi:hypothetical protein